MEKGLLKTIDETIENICKWANKEFQESKQGYREMMLSLDNDDKVDVDDFERKLKVIHCISELLEAKAALDMVYCQNREIVVKSPSKK